MDPWMRYRRSDNILQHSYCRCTSVEPLSDAPPLTDARPSKWLACSLIIDTWCHKYGYNYTIVRLQIGIFAWSVHWGPYIVFLVFWGLQHVCSQNPTHATLSPLGKFFYWHKQNGRHAKYIFPITPSDRQIHV